jgi:hypothetical protein
MRKRCLPWAMNNLVTLLNSFKLLIGFCSYFRPLSSDFNGVFIINCGSNIAEKRCGVAWEVHFHLK